MTGPSNPLRDAMIAACRAGKVNFTVTARDSSEQVRADAASQTINWYVRHVSEEFVDSMLAATREQLAANLMAEDLTGMDRAKVLAMLFGVRMDDWERFMEEYPVTQEPPK